MKRNILMETNGVGVNYNCGREVCCASRPKTMEKVHCVHPTTDVISSNVISSNRISSNEISSNRISLNGINSKSAMSESSYRQYFRARYIICFFDTSY